MQKHHYQDTQVKPPNATEQYEITYFVPLSNANQVSTSETVHWSSRCAVQSFLFYFFLNQDSCNIKTVFSSKAYN